MKKALFCTLIGSIAGAAAFFIFLGCAAQFATEEPDISCFESAYGRLKDAARHVRIITEGIKALARIGGEPSIIEILIEIEKARLRGLESVTPYEKEGVIYSRPGFELTEDIYEQAGLKVRRVALVDESGSTLAEEKMVADEVIVELDSHADAKTLTEDRTLSVSKRPPEGKGPYLIKIEDSKRVEEVLVILTEKDKKKIVRYAEPNGIINGD